jgi:hypothetical protein
LGVGCRIQAQEGVEMVGLRRQVVAMCLLCLYGAGAVRAGKLGDFEKDATQGGSEKGTERTPDHQHGHDDNDAWDDCCTPDLWGSMVEIVFGGIVYGGASSWMRVSAVADTNGVPILPEGFDLDLRAKGDPIIPVARLDVAYHHLDSGVSALDSRGEVGYGPVALSYQQTHYDEDDTTESLDLIHVHAIYRMTFSSRVELDAGYGLFSIRGEEDHSGGSLMMALLIYPLDRLGVEFRPTWAWIGGRATDTYDLGMFFRSRYGSLKGGYRWVLSPGETLNGPYVGMCFRY